MYKVKYPTYTIGYIENKSFFSCLNKNHSLILRRWKSEHQQ